MVKNKLRKMCSICFGERPKEVNIESCNHSFCTQCISNWAKKENTCPLCRKKFNVVYNNNNIIIDIVEDKNQQEIRWMEEEITRFYDYIYGVTYTTTTWIMADGWILSKITKYFDVLIRYLFPEKHISNYSRKKLNTCRYKDMGHFQRALSQ